MTPKELPEEKQPQSGTHRSRGAKVAKIAALSVGSVLLLIILLLTGATLWLTPQRLTEIVNHEASANLKADVKAYNVRFTLWSSWPHFRLMVDSLSLRSRVFDSLPANVKEQLPRNADFLASAGPFSGGVNLLALIKGDIELHNLQANDLNINLVSLNDSLSNYLILPPDTVKSRIPRITANKVTLLKGGKLRYQSLANGADATILLKALDLDRVDTKGKEKKVRIDGKGVAMPDRYALKVDGNIDAVVSGVTILNGFPFQLAGDLNLGFNPIRFSTSDYKVNLGVLHSNVNMEMEMGESSSLDKFTWHLDDFDLLRVLAYIPGVTLPDLDSFHAPLRVNATARLTSPWRLSSNVLPSAMVEFQIVDGDMSYTLSDGTLCTLRHEGAEGRLIFDGLDPAQSSFVIPPFKVTGEGIDLTLAAGMSDLLGNPSVEASIEGNAALRPIAKVFPMLRQFKLKGDVETLASFKADLLPLAQINGTDALKNMEMKGEIMLKDFSGAFEKNSLIASGKSLKLQLKADSKGDSLPNVWSLTGEGKGLRLNVPKQNVNLALSDLDMDFTLEKEKKSKTAPAFHVPSKWLQDTASYSFAPHLDPFLRVALPKEIKALMAQWRPSLNLKIGETDISTPSFPACNRVRNLNLYCSLDTLLLRNLYFRSRSSSLGMKGMVSNIRQFLTSPSPAPLNVKMDIAIDTLQINQLAGTYLRAKARRERGERGERGVGGEHSEDKGEAKKGEMKVTASDKVATLLPRNLVLDLGVHARETQYTNLTLHDLNGQLTMKDGDLNVRDMRVSTDFGHAFLNYGFPTSDIQNMGMSIDFELLDLNIVNFFKKFHTLLEMMPEMKNLEGELSAGADINLDINPDMYVDMPSISGDIRLNSEGLTLHQSKFIRHITRMLLIRNSGPLELADMKIHASIHDNLIELYPFTFAVDRYRLRMQGLNNFGGDLYYHLGVEKSLIPFSFGINILGNFSHPKIRFGGSHWKIRKGEVVSADIENAPQINIVASGKVFLDEFLHKAAEADK